MRRRVVERLLRARLMWNVSIESADGKAMAFLRRLDSVECFSDAAICFGSFSVNTASLQIERIVVQRNLG